MAAESVVRAMEQAITDMQNQVATMRQDLSGVTNMNVPTFIRTIEAKVQQIEAFVSSIGDVDKALSDKVNLIEQRLKEQFEAKSGWGNKPILECKAIQDLKAVIDGKAYRVWNRKFKNAFEQARPKSREAIEWLETVKEQKVMDKKGEDLDDTMAACIITIAQLDGGTEESIQLKCSILKDLNRDLWACLLYTSDAADE